MVNWDSFNVGRDARVDFHQPGAGSAILNRVHDASPSQVFGQINANGQVFLSNANGVTFGPSASVNVGGLVATTHDIDDQAFMGGSNQFSRNGSEASVVNQGQINVEQYAALLAPEVRNQGVIVARAQGSVVLVAGESIDLQIDEGGALLDLRVSAATVEALVDNGGAVIAPGGYIVHSAIT